MFLDETPIWSRPKINKKDTPNHLLLNSWLTFRKSNRILVDTNQKLNNIRESAKIFKIRNEFFFFCQPLDVGLTKMPPRSITYTITVYILTRRTWTGIWEKRRNVCSLVNEMKLDQASRTSAKIFNIRNRFRSNETSRTSLKTLIKVR
jgi:hypothetical protein